MVQIRTRLGALACAAALSLAASAHATTFELSYTFANGDAITGTLDGTQVGSLVDGISNVHLAFDGVAFAGSLIGSAWDIGATNYSAAAPVVSTDGALNNFIFADTNVGAGDYGYANYFTFVNDPALGRQVAGGFTTGLGNADVDGSGTWSLTASPVPEPASAGLLLAGLGLLAVAARRSRL